MIDLLRKQVFVISYCWTDVASSHFYHDTFDTLEEATAEATKIKTDVGQSERDLLLVVVGQYSLTSFAEVK